MTTAGLRGREAPDRASWSLWPWDGKPSYRRSQSLHCGCSSLGREYDRTFMATDQTGVSRGDGAAQPALLTVRQAAGKLTVSIRKVYNLIAEGKLPHYRIDNAIRVAVTDVESFVAACRIDQQPAAFAPVENVSNRARKSATDQSPVKASHLTIGPRQLALLRRGGVGISGPSDRSAG